MQKPRRFFALSAVAALTASAVIAPGSAGAQSTARCNGVVADFVGTSGADVLRGTSGDDVIVGLGGNDVIYGGGGNDIICGGSGNDEIYGEAGNDQISGGLNADRIRGGDGNDSVFGNRGHDALFGGQGTDILHGGKGQDVVRGNRGNDHVTGGSSADRLYGGKDNDSLFTTSDDLTVLGEAGTDRIDGRVDAADILGETGFELAVADEVFRLVNCARTNSSDWCNPGDQDGLDAGDAWNVSAAERNNLRAFTRDVNLDAGSKTWSEYLASSGRFAHDPNAGWENIAQGHVRSLNAGFPIVPDATLEIATASALSIMDQWMASSGHRSTILHPSLSTFGSGFEVGGLQSGVFQELYGTQRFR